MPFRSKQTRTQCPRSTFGSKFTIYAPKQFLGATRSFLLQKSGP